MKKILLSIFVLLFLLTAQVAFASWWNPFTWFQKPAIMSQQVSAKPVLVNKFSTVAPPNTSKPKNKSPEPISNLAPVTKTTTNTPATIQVTVTPQTTPVAPPVTYLTRQQITNLVSNVKSTIESTINASQAQQEISQLNLSIQNLQLQEQELNVQCMAYSYCKASSAQIEDMITGVTTNIANAMERLYEIKNQEQQVENEIQEDNQAITADQNEITSYRNTQFTQSESSCANSNDIAQADVSFCQSLFQ